MNSFSTTVVPEKLDALVVFKDCPDVTVETGCTVDICEVSLIVDKFDRTEQILHLARPANPAGGSGGSSMGLSI